ncbi:hypothetical protein [Paenibacillus polymyxa]|uniref:hypothetical protein n=1 Tax=Paenibacillus TaxID=44249 RepID=UPI000A6F33CF|nr:hypothetical protein [Paenibacillus polymyxa]
MAISQASTAFFLLWVLDVYDHEVIDFYMGLSCEGQHAAGLIQRSLWKRKLLDLTSVR